MCNGLNRNLGWKLDFCDFFQKWAILVKSDTQNGLMCPFPFFKDVDSHKANKSSSVLYGSLQLHKQAKATWTSLTLK